MTDGSGMTKEVTLDSIKNVKLFQPKRGYRFSVDALLLEDFIQVPQRSKGIELGTGSGIISILLAKRLKQAKISSVEIQTSLAGCAERNVKLNKLDDRIEIITDDIKNLGKIFSANKFDFVFSNPPFRKTKSGRLNINKECAIARHELKISLADLISSASYLLKNKGKFFLIYHPFRLIELIDLLIKKGLEPKRMRFVYSRRVEPASTYRLPAGRQGRQVPSGRSPAREGGEAKMVLIEAVKGSGTWLKIEPPFYIYGKSSEYSAGMRDIYKVKK